MHLLRIRHIQLSVLQIASGDVGDGTINLSYTELPLTKYSTESQMKLHRNIFIFNKS